MQLLIADDHELFRQGLSLVVANIFPNCHVYQEDNWGKVHQALEEHHFDLVLLDIFMPRQKKWDEELTQLVIQNPEIMTCVISASSEIEHLQTTFHSGIKGYICKTASTTEITKALSQIIQGKKYFPAHFLQKIKCFNDTPKQPLTLRQKEILKLMVKGKKNKIIAEELSLTENTVKRHIYNICQILHVNNRVEAVTLAIKENLLHYH